MEETTKMQEERLQTLRNSLTNFNRKFAMSEFVICPQAGTLAEAATIIAANVEALVRQRNRTPVQPEESAYRAVAKYIMQGSRPWLLLSGTPGTGKTTYLTAIERAARWAHASDPIAADIRFVKASSLGFMLKTSPAEWEVVKNCKLLLVDDIGFSGEEEVVNNYGVTARPVAELLEARYDRRLHTAMTTNLTLQEIKKNYGGRIYSRLAELATAVVMTGKDLRL